jgi:hypothetical protein
MRRARESRRRLLRVRQPRSYLTWIVFVKRTSILPAAKGRVCQSSARDLFLLLCVAVDMGCQHSMSAGILQTDAPVETMESHAS